jgi:hypothetical protein
MAAHHPDSYWGVEVEDSAYHPPISAIIHKLLCTSKAVSSLPGFESYSSNCVSSRAKTFQRFEWRPPGLMSKSDRSLLGDAGESEAIKNGATEQRPPPKRRKRRRSIAANHASPTSVERERFGPLTDLSLRGGTYGLSQIRSSLTICSRLSSTYAASADRPGQSAASEGSRKHCLCECRTDATLSEICRRACSVLSG